MRAVVLLLIPFLLSFSLAGAVSEVSYSIIRNIYFINCVQRNKIYVLPFLAMCWVYFVLAVIIFILAWFEHELGKITYNIKSLIHTPVATFSLNPRWKTTRRPHRFLFFEVENFQRHNFYNCRLLYTCTSFFVWSRYESAWQFTIISLGKQFCEIPLFDKKHLLNKIFF